MKNVLELEDLESHPASVHLLTWVLTVSVILSLSVLLWGKKNLFVSWLHTKDGVLFTKFFLFPFPFLFPWKYMRRVD